MPHITKEYFDGHFALPVFEECAQYLGIDLNCWGFSSGIEGETILEDGKVMEYLSVIYSPIRTTGFTLYGVMISVDGAEWEMQQFGTNQEDS